MSVALRALSRDDDDVLFEFMRDPESVQMAAFTSDDPSDRDRFDRWTESVVSRPDAHRRGITHDDVLVGSISSWEDEGTTEISYWIGRAHWGKGIASKALALFLGEMTARPLRARAASDNRGSLRVLEKAGFHVVGTEVAFASARGGEIEETILELSAPS